ncbi:MAG: LysE family transporter [Bacteroidales bacterium]|jgi:threonine/homoserine/homoserine lactone efflux protein|nr:LysE family transporter [Bacteroidales bacterium]
MDLFVEGIIAGFIIAVSLGPAFIVMIQAGVKFGSRSAFFAASGILLGDLLLCGIAIFGLASFVAMPSHKLWLGIGSGALLISFGIAGFITAKKPVKDTASVINKLPAKRLLIKTFLINNSNPFNWLFWLALAGYARASAGSINSGFTVFFIGVWFIVLISTFIKAHLSLRLGNWLQGKAIGHINQIAAAIFLLAGIGIIFKTIF